MARSSTGLALAPALCAMHCIATPVLVAAAPAFAAEPAVEWAAFALSVAAATSVLAPAVRRRRFLAVLSAAAGFGAWITSLVIVAHGPAHTPLLVAGSLTVALALLLELRHARFKESPRGLAPGPR